MSFDHIYGAFSFILTLRYCKTLGCIQGPQKVKYGKAGTGETVITAKDIIIATGSIPLVPKGIEVDGEYCLFVIVLSQML